MKTKNYFRLLPVLILLSISSQVFGQCHALDSILKTGERDFKKITHGMNEYYETHSTGKGSGFNQYMRWHDFHRTHLKDGQVINLGAYILKEEYNYQQSHASNSARLAATSTGNWTCIGPNNHIILGNGYSDGIGRINCISIDPSNSNIIYVGTPGGGLWKTTTGGNSWTCLTDGLGNRIGISGIAIDPSSPTTNRTIYILTGDGDGGSTPSTGVFKSTDNGNTWYSTGLTWDPYIQYAFGYKLTMHPTNNQILYAATRDGLYKTINGGISWTIKLYGSIYDFEFKPGNPNIMYATGSGMVHRSTDTGETWTVQNGLPNSYSRCALAVTPANPEMVYVLYGGETQIVGKFEGLYRSSDSGLSFSLRSETPNLLGWSQNGQDSGNQGWYDLSLAVSPSNENELIVGGINTWMSSNGGTSWSITSHWVRGQYVSNQDKYTHADIHFLDYLGSTIFCGSDGGIFKSTDTGSTWQNLSTGLSISEIYRIGIDQNNPTKTICGLQDNGVNLMNNGILNQWYGGDGFEGFVDPTNSQIIYGETQFAGIIKSTDGGLTMENLYPETEPASWNAPFRIDPLNPATIYIGKTNIHKSTNRGSHGSWTTISNFVDVQIHIDEMAIAPSDPNTIYAVRQIGGLWRTTNGGTGWTNLNTFDKGFPVITYIAVHPTTPTTLWISCGWFWEGQKVYKSTNGGTTWTNVSGTLPNVAVNCILYQNNTNNALYIGTDIGVFYKDDSMSDWIPFSNGIPIVIVKELEIHQGLGKLRAGTYGRGLYEGDLYGAGCASFYDFLDNANTTGTVTVTANDSISSNRQITGTNSIVTYQAGNKIRLKPGFKASINNTFRAQITPCTSPMLRQTQKVLTGTYAGPLPGVVEALETEETTTDVEEKIIVYPNPFASITNIDFTITENSLVSISLFDIFGKEVAKVVQLKSYEKGMYKVSYDGSQIPNGIYYCILNANDKKYVSKVVITK